MLPSDRRLVERALAGKRDAWERLIRRHEKKVYNFALRMTGHREDALDLMQEIFLSVYRCLGTFSGRSSFSTWLFSIASRRAVDSYRRRRPEVPVTDPEETPGAIAAGEGPLAEVIRGQDRERCLALLSNLPIEQRLVLELKFFQEQTFEEMSRTLGVSTNTLKTRFYTALKKLRAMPEASHAV